MYWGTSAQEQNFGIPAPEFGSAAETQRLVDSARNAHGEVVATMIGRSSDKQNMTWKVLPPEIWWSMNQFLESNGMFFWCRYFSHNTGVWRVRQFYAGDVYCEPDRVDCENGPAMYYRNCTLNVIDQGVIGQ